MKNKNIFIIIAASALISLTLFTYIYFKKKQEFEKSLESMEIQSLTSFKVEKEKRISLLNGEKRLLQLFDNFYEEHKAIEFKDTIFAFLFFKHEYNFKVHNLNYFNCLQEKCNLVIDNEIANTKIENKITELESKYNQTFLQLYPKLEERLLSKSKSEGRCSKYFSVFEKITFEENLWNEFEEFMIHYNVEQSKIKINNNLATSQFNLAFANSKTKFKSDIIPFFNNIISENKGQLIQSSLERNTYTGYFLGKIEYDLERIIFNSDVFQDIINDTYEEQWKNNSLSTGSMPYSNCYGANNNCYTGGCSNIKVITDGSGDVLVSIKNSNGNVVRHAYIKGGASFTFEVPNGRYQVFFYSGTGWNPNKTMPSTCKSLNGGFVSNEEVTKDDYISLYNQIMTYELILQQNGNLQTQPSSKSEAF